MIRVFFYDNCKLSKEQSGIANPLNGGIYVISLYVGDKKIHPTSIESRELNSLFLIHLIQF